jgi:hypothetical protein
MNRVGVGPRTRLMQEFVNALRACLGKDPLYDEGDSKDVEAERFYVPERQWAPSRWRGGSSSHG